RAAARASARTAASRRSGRPAIAHRQGRTPNPDRAESRDEAAAGSTGERAALRMRGAVASGGDRSRADRYPRPAAAGARNPELRAAAADSTVAGWQAG